MADEAAKVFRCRTLVAAGVANAALAVAAFVGAVVIEHRIPGAEGGALALVVGGAVLLVLAAARLTARLEVHGAYLVWVSFFRRNRVPLAALTNASLNRGGATGANNVALAAVADPQLWGFDLALFTLLRLLAPTSGRVHVLNLHWEDGRVTRTPAVCTHRFDYSFSDAAKAMGAASDAIVHFHQTYGGYTGKQWGAGGVTGAGVYGQGGWESVGLEQPGAMPGPTPYGPDPATGLRPHRPGVNDVPDVRPAPYGTIHAGPEDVPPPFAMPHWSPPLHPTQEPLSPPPAPHPAAASSIPEEPLPPTTGQP